MTLLSFGLVVAASLWQMLHGVRSYDGGEGVTLFCQVIAIMGLVVMTAMHGPTENDWIAGFLTAPIVALPAYGVWEWTGVWEISVGIVLIAMMVTILAGAGRLFEEKHVEPENEPFHRRGRWKE